MSSHADPTLEELCRSFLGGDGEALQRVIERTAPLLVRFAYRFTANQDDAEDIAQEVFIRLFKHLHRIDLSRPIKPWLLHVCANLCRNLAARRKSILFSALEREDDEEGSAVASVESEEPTPDADVRRSDDVRMVRAALLSLPEKYRVVLSLFYFDSLSYEEISSSLSLPLNTVRTHIRRGKLLLEEELARAGLLPS